jgi:ribosomal protein S18 acetylase RimI-like enzyme
MEETGIRFRDAREDEAPLIVQLIRRMVADMAAHGGHAPTADSTAVEKLETAVADELKESDAKYVIAESVNGDVFGIAGAQLITLGGAFAPKRVLHISAVYVLPQFRRSGIGGALLARILEWGRTAGGQECDLNVLSANPAKSLYEKHGFSVAEVKMVRSL